jgi:hypothetical protein
VFCCRSKRLISKLTQTGNGVVKIGASHLQVHAKGNLGESWARWMKALRLVPNRPLEGVRVDSLHLRALVLLHQMLSTIQVTIVRSRPQQITQHKKKTPKQILRCATGVERY